MNFEKNNQNLIINKKLEPKKEWIYLDDHEILRKKSEPVKELNQQDLDIISKMVSYIDTCYNNEYKKLDIKPGIAVAAPQMGLSKRIIYIHFNEDEIEHQYLLINPEIISYSDSSSYIEGGEGCLSVPNDIVGNIERKYKIVVSAFDLLQNKKIEIVAKNLLSICIQHEIDHLDGILYPDRINKKNPNFAKLDWIKF